MAAPTDEASAPEGAAFGRRSHSTAASTSSPSKAKHGWDFSEGKDAGGRTVLGSRFDMCQLLPFPLETPAQPRSSRNRILEKPEDGGACVAGMQRFLSIDFVLTQWSKRFLTLWKTMKMT